MIDPKRQNYIYTIVDRFEGLHANVLHKSRNSSNRLDPYRNPYERLDYRNKAGDTMKKVHVEVPYFAGTIDAHVFSDWLASLESYFEGYDMPDESWPNYKVHIDYKVNTANKLKVKATLANDLLELEEETSLLSVVRRILVAPNQEENWKCTSIFQTIVRRGTKAWMIIIDGGSDMNVVSEATVERLKLPMEPHPKPYNVAWINSTSILVTKRYLVPISCGQYGQMKQKQAVKPKDVAATQKNLKDIIETLKQRAIQPQKEVEELEQDADKSEKFAKMVEQPDEQLVDPKQQVIPTKLVTPSTPRNSGLDEKKKGKGHATKSTEPEEQAEESNQQTEKCQQLEDDLKQQLTSLMEETLESKEDSMMKEGNKEMEKSFPTLPHVHQVKDVSLAMVVPIVDFVIPEKV
uniref:Uncharacterized protein n=1 Tax=Quercus lobata TaxID=97700 RepID=A0A7N2KQN2_QUELO